MRIIAAAAVLRPSCWPAAETTPRSERGRAHLTSQQRDAVAAPAPDPHAKRNLNRCNTRETDRNRPSQSANGRFGKSCRQLARRFVPLR